MTEAANIPGHRGYAPIEDLVEFIDGPQSGKKLKNMEKDKQKNARMSKKGGRENSENDLQKVRSGNSLEQVNCDSVHCDGLSMEECNVHLVCDTNSVVIAKEKPTAMFYLGGGGDGKPPLPVLPVTEDKCTTLTDAEKFVEEDFKLVTRRHHRKYAVQEVVEGGMPRRATSFDNCTTSHSSEGDEANKRTRRNSTGSTPVVELTDVSDVESVKSMPAHPSEEQQEKQCEGENSTDLAVENENKTALADKTGAFQRKTVSPNPTSGGNFRKLPTEENAAFQNTSGKFSGASVNNVAEDAEPEVVMNYNDVDSFPSLPSKCHLQASHGMQVRVPPSKSYAAVCQKFDRQSYINELPNFKATTEADCSSNNATVQQPQVICDTCANPDSNSETGKRGIGVEGKELLRTTNELCADNFVLPAMSLEVKTSESGGNGSSPNPDKNTVCESEHSANVDKCASQRQNSRMRAPRLVFEIGGTSSKGRNYIFGANNSGLSFGYEETDHDVVNKSYRSSVETDVSSVYYVYNGDEMVLKDVKI